jgi:hypothetical protein
MSLLRYVGVSARANGRFQPDQPVTSTEVMLMSERMNSARRVMLWHDGRTIGIAHAPFN